MLEPLGLCLHSTGAGLWERWHRENQGALQFSPVNLMQPITANWTTWKGQRGKEPYPFDTAVRVYASLMLAGPHVVVCGETGRVAFGTPLNYVAHHVGSQGSGLYKYNGWKSKHAWWLERWPEYRSPRELLNDKLWKTASANQLLIGIEVSPPRISALAPWTEDCYAAIKRVALYCQNRYPSIALDDHSILTHSDVHPLKRTARGVPTDPPPSQWRRGHAEKIMRDQPYVQLA